MRKRFARLLLMALVAAWVGILLTAGDSPAQLYRYTDKNGNIVFTDNPPPGVVVEPVDDEKAVAAGKGRPRRGDAAGTGRKPSPQPQAGREPAAPMDKDKEAEMKRMPTRRSRRKRRSPEEAAGKTAGEATPPRGGRPAGEGGQQPVQPTQENIDRQLKLMQDAQRLREMP